MPSTQNIIDIYMLIDECLKRNLIFAAYKLPGDKHVQLALQTTSDIETASSPTNKKGFVFFPFSNSHSTAIRIRADHFLTSENISDDALIQILSKTFFSKNGHKKPLPHHTTKDEFCGNVASLVNAIKKNELQKAVLSRVYLHQISQPFSVTNYFRNLAELYEDAFVSMVHVPHHGFWIGASPELLLKATKDEIRSASLAGTKKKGNTNEWEWGMKETDEQKIVTDHIRRIFKKHFDKEPAVEGPVTVKAGAVEHLKTILKTPMEKKISMDDFIKDLHPTPAVAGVPRDIALKWIAWLEKHDREYYCGFSGPVNLQKNVTELYVNLRCMNVYDEHLALYVGAGITAESDPELEWEETELKALTLLNAL